MTDSVLTLHHITKTFILGNRKNAKKAQKALRKLQNKYENDSAKNIARSRDEEERLYKARKLFSEEKFEESYQVVTGKKLKPRRKDRGVVVHALNDVSLDIKKGELVAVMGPSGSGKSTLLNMLGLLDAPTAGQITIHGRNVTAIKHRDLPALRSMELGFVFQSFNLVTTLTALENVMLPLRYAGVPLRERKRRAKKALGLVGLANRMNHVPDELSGGQQQRVAIARSIVNNPSIIFGDELTGELDSKMTAEVMELITKLNKTGQTFIIVTHNPEVAKYCTRVIYMRDGKVEHDKS